ncbi:hypothetical protein AGROH133_09889 [Agrobacterium tumefaciens]|nr:hypothetical protein AGROH133_09889 [Agrobacterium tumefaciens]
MSHRMQDAQHGIQPHDEVMKNSVPVNHVEFAKPLWIFAQKIQLLEAKIRSIMGFSRMCEEAVTDIDAYYFGIDSCCNLCCCFTGTATDLENSLSVQPMGLRYKPRVAPMSANRRGAHWSK